jgi:cholesterol transport system auxiliary component
MNRLPRWLLVVSVLVSCLGGCFSLNKPGNRIDYYTIEYTPPKLPDLSPLGAVVRVERFLVAPAYNTRRIVYQDRSFARNEYIYQQWRPSPGDMVTFFLTRDMRESGLFEAILPYESRLAATYALDGSVDEFFEKDKEDHWMAVVSIGVTLTVEKEPDTIKKIIYQKSYRAEEPCARKNAQALAAAMSSAMERISRNLIEDVYNHLKKRSLEKP